MSSLANQGEALRLARGVVASAGVPPARYPARSVFGSSVSLPELVTALAAVRRGALTLAVAGVIGGNAFDTLVLALSDVAYRPASIYHAAAGSLVFLAGLTTLLTTILLLGLLRREKHGFANIGFESVLILLVYVAGMMFLFVAVNGAS